MISAEIVIMVTVGIVILLAAETCSTFPPNPVNINQTPVNIAQHVPTLSDLDQCTLHLGEAPYPVDH